MEHKPMTEERLRQIEERSNLAQGRIAVPEGSVVADGTMVANLMKYYAKESIKDVPDLVAEVRRLNKFLQDIVDANYNTAMPKQYLADIADFALRGGSHE